MEPVDPTSFTSELGLLGEVQREPPPSYHEVGWFKFLTFGWVTPMVEVGVERQLDLLDTPELAPAEDSLVNSQRFLNTLEVNEHDGKRHALLRAYVWAFKWELAIMFTWNFFNHNFGLLNTLLFEQVLIFQDRNRTAEETDYNEEDLLDPVTRGLLAVVGLVALGLFRIFWEAQKDLYQERLKTRLRVSMQGVVMLRAIQTRPDQPGSDPSEEAATTAAPITPYNVLSFDVEPNVSIIFTILGIWLFPYQLFTTLALLYSRVGIAVMAGLLTLTLAKVGNAICYTFDGVLRDRLLQAKDRRLGLCSEAFLNIRALQMLSWVNPFQARIEEARTHELNTQRTRLWLTKMIAALDYSLPELVTLATLAYFVTVEGGEMKASLALPVIDLVKGLASPWGGPFTQIPQWINQILVWKSAYKRVNTFIGVDPNPKATLAMPSIRRSLALAGNVEMVEVDGGRMKTPVPGLAAQMQQCTLSWEADDSFGGNSGFSLQNMDFSLKGGELVLLVGKSGQGKSSVLYGLLGEMLVRSGYVHSPAATWRNAELRTGSKSLSLPATTKAARQLVQEDEELNLAAVPYAGQTATLYTGTVRSNILFGTPYMPDLYGRVLSSCALETDLATMAAGDLTLVAQGGTTLSGGQRARVGLARAVYRAVVTRRQQPDFVPLVLLDDPFSALDRRVALEVCKALFTQPDGLLSGCGVLVATNDPWWLKSISAGRNASTVPASTASSDASAVPRVAILRSGRLEAYGTLDQVADKDFAEVATALQFEEQAEGSSNPIAKPQGHDGKVEQSTANKVKERASKEPRKAAVQEEHREQGRVKLRTYKAYVSAAGPLVFFTTLVILIGIGIFRGQFNLVIAFWTDKNPEDNVLNPWFQFLFGENATDPDVLLGMLAVCALLFSLSNFGGHGGQIIGGMRAARKMFSEALDGTLGMPFRWWDTNPTGRTLNRFSEDVQKVDEAITEIFGIIFGALVFFLEGIFFVGLSTPAALLLIPPIAVGLEYFARYYRNTIQELHRIWLVSMGKVYQEICETLDGKLVVRAYALQRRSVCQGMDNIDRFQQITFAKWSLSAWLSLRMRLLGFILNAWTTFAPVFQYFELVGETSTSMVGFAISYSNGTIGILQQFINNFSQLEMELISIERLLEYADARKTESLPTYAMLMKLLTGQQGQLGLEMRDVEVAYYEGGRPVLSEVSLHFSPGETVAVVGRTGAGKSSLLLSVLQLVSYKGSISVNGMDLALLPSRDVRQQLVGVVPQHPTIFAGDVGWNLDPQRTKSYDEMQAVLEAVGLWDVCRAAGGMSAMLTATGDTDAQAAHLSLSQSQQQLFSTARVLLRKPRVVLLDEITSSLQSDVAKTMLRTLLQQFKSTKATVILVTHQEKLIPLCEREIRIVAGRIASDKRQVVTDA